MVVLDSPSSIYNHLKLRCNVGIIAKHRAVSDVMIRLMLGFSRMHVDCWRSVQKPVSLVFAI
jgi:hypothetical protein